ncbi:unnamed protein product [marine sediment metagenome]|uniref:Sulfotransferase family protein n=1 Tax=marine sediment metagenome TaxID=412755 RepID=X0TD87_9ZZZZ
MSIPKVLIFDHIAKCGGTSVQNMLMRAGCPILRLYVRGREYRNHGGPGPLLISAHEIFRDLPAQRDEWTFYFTFLRNPLDCFYSQVYASKPEGLSFAETVDLQLAEGARHVVKKFTLHPSDYDFVGTLEDWELSVAKLGKLTGLKLNPNIREQQSGRPAERPKEEQLTRVLRGPIALWQDVRATLRGA